MSAYSTNVTQFRDRELLLCALAELGFDATMVEVNETAQQLFDYHGRATTYTDIDGDKAEIIIRRQYVGSASNDLGFRKTVNGTYEAIISAYDRSGHGYDESWVGLLSASYARHGLIKKASKQGLRHAGNVQKNGKTEMLFVRV